jgi:hypothetical protein
MGKVNGKKWDWNSIEAKIPGMILDIQDIDYGDELEKEALYGKGNMPNGYGTGNYKPTLKFSMLRDDFDRLLRYCKKNNVTLYGLVIPKVIVSYADNGEKTIVDEIENVTLDKVTNKGGQGDKSLKVDINCLVYGKIIRDGVQPV